jgi:hypothetical protein
MPRRPDDPHSRPRRTPLPPQAATLLAIAAVLAVWAALVSHG